MPYDYALLAPYNSDNTYFVFRAQLSYWPAAEVVLLTPLHLTLLHSLVSIVIFKKFTLSIAHPLIHSLTLSPTHSLTHSLNYSLSLSHTHSNIHSYIHCLIRTHSLLVTLGVIAVILRIAQQIRQRNDQVFYPSVGLLNYVNWYH
jgi:hypothetical protein